MSKPNLSLIAIILALLAAGALVACAPQAAPEPTAAGADTESGAETPGGPTPFPTYNYVLPTSPPVFSTIAATAQATREATAEATVEAVEVASAGNLDPVAVERGQGRYEALECGACHGADAAGTDDGPSLLGPSLEEEAFISFLRTGGTIGNDHLYSTNRLSDSGGRNLYQYIRSLSAAAASS